MLYPVRQLLHYLRLTNAAEADDCRPLNAARERELFFNFCQQLAASDESQVAMKGTDQ